MPAAPFGIVGVSQYAHRLCEDIRTVARGGFPVLVTGPSGSGKELVARAVHAASGRSGQQLVAVNCAAIPKHLEESEFFGHMKGSFTGADREKTGLVAMAHGSTLFLDEVGETSPAIQAKLLRVLDSGEFLPVGASEPRTVDIRLVSATNRDMFEMVERGFFREDLYYRLKGAQVRTRPLREHSEDIPPLVAHFLRQHRVRGKPVEVTPGAMAMLVEHSWPGNVRELRYTVEVLAVAAESRGAIDEATVHTVLGLDGADAAGEWFGPYVEARARVLREFDLRYFGGLLHACRGNVSEIARRSGLFRPSVQRKLNTVGLCAGEFRRHRHKTGAAESRRAG